MNGGLVRSDVPYYTGSSNKSGSPLSFSQAAAAEPRLDPPSTPAETPKHRETDKREGRKKVQRDNGRKYHTHTHTPARCTIYLTVLNCTGDNARQMVQDTN